MLQSVDWSTAAQYPAVALFVERARAARHDFELTPANADTVAEVCRRLDGLPLAIELAAARIRALTPATLLARLRDHVTVVGGGAPDRPPKHRALATAIDWSYALLDEAERTLFRRLAVFEGGFSLEAAEALGADAGTPRLRPARRGDAGTRRRGDGKPAGMAISASPRLTVSASGAAGWGEVLGLLVRLVEKSLVVALASSTGEARYRMLATIRAYALERLAESGEEELVRARQAAYFLRLGAATIGESERAASRAPLARLDGQEPNLRVAVDYLAERGHLRAAYALGDALARAMEQAGRVREGAALLAALLGRPAPPSARASPERVRALLAAFQLSERQGELTRARELLTEVLAIARERADRAGVAQALSWLGSVTRDQGALLEARALLDESLDLYRELGDAGAVAMALDRLGTVAHALGDLSAAQRCYAESETLLRPLRLPGVLCWSLHNQALLALDRGDVAAAVHLATESTAVRRRIDDRSGLLYGVALFAAILADGVRGTPTGERRATTALQLAGAVDAVCVATGRRLMPIYGQRFSAAVAAARRALDPAAAAAAWEQGHDLSLEEALDRALAEPVAAEPEPRAELTPREQDVAALVARGLTNREIAERLVLSVRTVDRHIGNILSKLGLRTRAQVGVWLTGQREDRRLTALE